ncbi:Peroxisomal phytanoyl-CoA hydroxylase [Ceraceosorus bombacis]|uniref:Peroxisomal phytanoyl-CoA hydroxylase n=1 Tax=Ceraceosorus bombacis TaxID=401625 RepID=A0A0P1BSS4_9BASI|nr:Peroxisomal phytanoyl-CoA hydroxylase [Ceraceosorus bombacis]
MSATATDQSHGAGCLSPEQLLRYQRDGYLRIPSFFASQAADVLLRAKHIINAFDPSGHPMTKFSTGDGSSSSSAAAAAAAAAAGEAKHTGDDYFLNSNDKVRWFLEEDAVGKDGKLNRPPERSVNKAGHALHTLDPTFHAFTFSERVQNLVRSVGAHIDPRVLQSMIICKQPCIGGAVPPHNDSTFLYTSPPTAMGLWFALEPCKASNGALSFLPGSHRWPVDQQVDAGAGAVGRDRRPPLDGQEARFGVQRGINRRFVRRDATAAAAAAAALDGSASGTEFLAFNEEDDDDEKAATAAGAGEEAMWSDDEAELVECEPGDVVLIHGSVLHRSTRNTSEKSRFIYTFHIIEGDQSRAIYDRKNWLWPPPSDGDDDDDSQKGFAKLFHPPPAPREADLFLNK